MRKPLVVALLCLVPSLALHAAGAGASPGGDDLPLRAWPAAPYWAPTPQAATVATTILPFVALTPCRIVDTRGGAPLGGGYLPASTPRDYTLTGQCGIPAGAAAVSLNVTVTATGGPGYVSVWPAGGSQPTVSTLNYLGSQTIANAAVVPLSAGGAASFACMNSGCDLVVDTNGYYAATNLVNTVNGLTGDVTLSPGSNVSITPSGNTLTIAATGAVSSVSGTNGISASPATGAVTVTSNATSLDTPSTIVSRDGAGDFHANTVTIDGNISFPSTTATTGHLDVAGIPLLVAYPFQNLFVGFSAGNFTTTQLGHTGVGYGAIHQLTTGTDDTAVGSSAGYHLTTGSRNTLVGAETLEGADASIDNTFIGYRAGQQGLNPGYSTAVGSTALRFDNGFANVAVGYAALGNVTSGQRNIGIGLNAGAGLTTGTDNIFIGGTPSPATNTYGSIYIGQQGPQSGKTYIAGITGATVPGGVTVIVDGNGHLGTTTSSRRYKEGIVDIGAESDLVMALRPVAFTYRRDLDPDGIRQYGLIAEEVEQVAPQLVVTDAQGRPDGVRYQLLPPLLLNEVQKLRRAADERAREVDDLRRALAAALSRIEILESRERALPAR